MPSGLLFAEEFLPSAPAQGSRGRQAWQMLSHRPHRYENEGHFISDTEGPPQVTRVQLGPKAAPSSEETGWTDGPRQPSAYKPPVWGAPRVAQPCLG